MRTKLMRAAAAAVRDWCAETGHPATIVRHIHPRAYVIGRTAPLCLVVSAPWQDSEPQLRDSDRSNPLKLIYTFDPSLDAGMWCATAYVVRGGVQETVAIQFEGAP